MKKLVAVAALALLALARPAGAQDAAAEPSPARMRAAEELTAAMEMDRNFASYIDAMVDAQVADNPAVRQYQAEFRAFFHRYMGWDQLKPDILRLYAETYTEDEMRQLAAFYRTPLGRRVMETLPELSARSTEIGQRRVREHLPELLGQLELPDVTGGVGKKP